MATRAASVVAAIVQQFENTSSEELLRQMRDSGVPLDALVRGLLRTGDGDVRDWTIQVVGTFHRTEELDQSVAVEIIRERALQDADADVRDEATRLFVALAPARAHEVVPRLRARLASDDYFLPVSAMWMLLELGDRASIPLVERYRERTGIQRWQGKQAEIVLAAFEGDDVRLAERIISHDHDLMPALCRAATLMGTARLRGALSKCAAANFDAECSERCGRALSRLLAAGA